MNLRAHISKKNPTLALKIIYGCIIVSAPMLPKCLSTVCLMNSLLPARYLSTLVNSSLPIGRVAMKIKAKEVKTLTFRLERREWAGKEKVEKK